MKIWIQAIFLILVTGPFAWGAPGDTRLSLNLKFSFNIEADFDRGESIIVGGTATPGPASGGGLDRIYDDGYIRIDSSGNQDGLTWYWGYEDSSQYDADAQTITLTAAEAAGATQVLGADGDTAPGVEVVYERDISVWGKSNWGLQAAIAFSNVDISDSTTLSTSFSLIADSFDLGSVIPPNAPYEGSLAGPGPLIGDSPTRATRVETTTISGTRTVNTTLFGLKLGPYVDIPLSKQAILRIEGGFAALKSRADFTIEEFIANGNDPAIPFQDRISDSETLTGPYAEFQLHFKTRGDTTFFLGIEFADLGTQTLSVGNQSATIHLDSVTSAQAGVKFPF